MAVRFPNPKNVCSFCSCLDIDTSGEEKPLLRECPFDEKYDPGSEECVPSSGVCPNHRSRNCTDPGVCKDCQGVTCTPGDYGKEVRFPNPKNVCSFCSCLDIDSSGEEKPLVEECPFDEKYDPGSDECVPSSGVCPNHGGRNCTDDGNRLRAYGDGCRKVSCPYDPYGVPLKANPGDPMSYCQCDWGGRVHQMPCSPGTKFSVKEQVCI